MSATDSGSSPQQKTRGQYELICSFKANDVIPVHKYKSATTGLTIIMAEIEGPVIHGYFVLATEAHDDDGLPHTLEHLIFLGSETYPYKGVLDIVANRCLASGTNAWTDTDHTCYTMTTAGSEGFLSLMPIYLDHILYPTLTDSAFVTEVHHVTEEGEDGGVVYCEMQGRENSGESRTYLAMIRAVYPGHCGYKSETGGIMKNLRESTTNEKVRRYHKQFYRPENLALIITGSVNHNDVFQALSSIENKILSKGNQGPFRRPWQDSVPPLSQSVDIDVHYPCDEEDNGMVYTAWRGPYCIKERYNLTACSILLKYMTDTAVSPLQKSFVEIDDPFASEVDYSVTENSVSMIHLKFENVPMDKLKLVKGRLSKILQSIANGEERLDMSRLRTVIHRQILEDLSELDSNPHDSMAYMIIGDVLYGNTRDDLRRCMNKIENLRSLEKERENFWVNLVRKYFVESPNVTVCGVPSIEEQKKMSGEDKQRIQLQREALGPEGLKGNGETLRKATAENEVPPPGDMLSSVPIPKTDSINFHPIERFTSTSEEQHPQFNLKKIPLQMHLDNLHTNFVYIYVLMDTSRVKKELRPYLPLLLESIMKLPIKRKEVIPYEKVVAELEMDTVTVATNMGVDSASQFQCGPFSNTVTLMLLLEPAKYIKGIFWVRELLYQTIFTPERLKIIATKIINEVAQVKRQGHRVVRDLMKGLMYKKDSNPYATSVLRQYQFLTGLIEKLNAPDSQKVVLNDMNRVRNLITNPETIVIHVATDTNVLLKTVNDPVRPWLEIFPCECIINRRNFPIIHDSTLLNAPDYNELNSCVVGMGCVESSFFYQTTRTIDTFTHPDFPPLLVFLQYFTQLEGPLWKQVRGLGLAYGYSLVPRLNEGLLYLSFYRATNCVLAYKEVKNIIDTHLSDRSKWDRVLLESARSSLMYEVIDREKSIEDVITQSLLSYFRKTDKNYNKNLVQLISRVEVDDLIRVGPKYVAPLFDAQNCKTCIVCHPSKTEEIAKAFGEMGIQMQIYQSLEDSFLNKW